MHFNFGYIQTFTVGTLSPAQLSEHTMHKVCGGTRNTRLISRCGSAVWRQHCSELSWNVFHPVSYSQ